MLRQKSSMQMSSRLKRPDNSRRTLTKSVSVGFLNIGPPPQYRSKKRGLGLSPLKKSTRASGESTRVMCKTPDKHVHFFEDDLRCCVSRPG